MSKTKLFVEVTSCNESKYSISTIFINKFFEDNIIKYSYVLSSDEQFCITYFIFTILVS